MKLQNDLSLNVTDFCEAGDEEETQQYWGKPYRKLKNKIRSCLMNDNCAFLYGDAVSVYFFVRNGKLILTEECYFFPNGFYAKDENEHSAFFQSGIFSSISLNKKITADALENAFIHFLVL